MTFRDITSALWYQHPGRDTITTMAPCHQCGEPSRGGATCTECLKKALAKMAGPQRALTYVHHIRGIRRQEAFFKQLEETL